MLNAPSNLTYIKVGKCTDNLWLKQLAIKATVLLEAIEKSKKYYSQGKFPWIVSNVPDLIVLLHEIHWIGFRLTHSQWGDSGKPVWDNSLSYIKSYTWPKPWTCILVKWEYSTWLQVQKKDKDKFSISVKQTNKKKSITIILWMGLKLFPSHRHCATSSKGINP